MAITAMGSASRMELCSASISCSLAAVSPCPVISMGSTIIPFTPSPPRAGKPMKGSLHPGA